MKNIRRMNKGISSFLVSIMSSILLRVTVFLEMYRLPRLILLPKIKNKKRGRRSIQSKLHKIKMASLKEVPTLKLLNLLLFVILIQEPKVQALHLKIKINEFKVLKFPEFFHFQIFNFRRIIG